MRNRIKRLIRINHKIIMQTVPMMYMIGVTFTVILGAQIIRGSWDLAIDVARYPLWVGRLLFWGGFIMLIGFVVEMAWQLYWQGVRERIRKERRASEGLSRVMRRIR